VNRIVRTFKTLLFHAVVDLEVIERNVLLRFKQFERRDANAGARVNRAAFTERKCSGCWQRRGRTSAP
jgi:hypothetical protein